MSDLTRGKYFSFANSNVVYYVEQVVYSGNQNGDFHLFYSKLNTDKTFKWSTFELDKSITIYDN
ncbi:hypothetical protein HNP37_003981 [Flavobacterium nitrogenifigens]|uniref:Uncharacterized protein n=2 Tax=Flavobacterium TaxID=237 RepID=A0A7W7J0B5_9FLAO|nr:MULTISPECIES: hypothetical protein [Flavobacterium]MBB4803901.1 hypothetical protein [Flavobacterium nitrogenifigens]MBB6388947.1 hypothetical protein [Flavobacterium notoginsengisoli]